MENNQREITPKICKQELWFFSMTHHIIVFYKCTKFHRNIFGGFRDIKRTRFVTDRRKDRRTDRQTHGEKQYVSRPFGGRHNKKRK